MTDNTEYPIYFQRLQFHRFEQMQSVFVVIFISKLDFNYDWTPYSCWDNISVDDYLVK